MNEFIENEMLRVKDSALRSLSSIAHFKDEISKQSFITMFVYCWQESLSAAEKISDELDLDKGHFLALLDDFDAFKDYYLEHYVEAQNF
ncbi:MAG TPA: hypothetical protein VHZ50_16495 [Puia sp.]|nr:hypothetical protein [Puia sp.]